MNKDFANLSDRKKKLRWHSWHRGMRELDILVGTMVDNNIFHMSEEDLIMLEEFLELDDAVLWSWVSKQKPIDAKYDNQIWKWICEVSI